MKTICAFVCLLIAVSAQDFIDSEQNYPSWYHSPEHLRYRRQLSMDPNSGDVTYNHRTSPNGQVFGTLGSRDDALFGKGGYKHNIFDDNRGKLDASGYGTHVISPYGSANQFGGRVDYAGDHSKASLDVSKQMHGMTAVDAAAGGRWPIGKNGDVSVEGTYNRMGPMKDYGMRAGVNYRW